MLRRCPKRLVAPCDRRPTFEQIKQSASVLGIDMHQSFTPKDVKNRYHELALQHHPDAGGDPKTMSDITTAQEVLSSLSIREKQEFLAHDRFFDKSRGSAQFCGFQMRYTSSPTESIMAQQQRRVCRFAMNTRQFYRNRDSGFAGYRSGEEGAGDGHGSTTEGRDPRSRWSQARRASARGAAAGGGVMMADIQEARARKFSVILAGSFTILIYCMYRSFQNIQQQVAKGHSSSRSFSGNMLKRAEENPQSLSSLSEERQKRLQALHQQRFQLNENIRQARLKSLYKDWDGRSETSIKNHVSSTSGAPSGNDYGEVVSTLLHRRAQLNAEIEECVMA